MQSKSRSDNLPVHAAFSSIGKDIDDDIECFAVEQMIGRLDGYTDKENVRWDPRECVLLATGTWKERKFDFPPAPQMAPAYVGLNWVWGDVLTYQQLLHFRKWQPIGCRDPETVRLFSHLGIEAFFSSSMIFGLQRWIDQTSQSEIIAVDLPPDFKTPAGAVVQSHKCARNNHPQFVRSQTKEVLESYQRASLVLTTRLSAAFACLAFGTPVVLIASDFTPELGAIIALMDFVSPDHSGPLIGKVISKELRKQLSERAKETLLRSIETARDKYFHSFQ